MGHGGELAVVLRCPIGLTVTRRTKRVLILATDVGILAFGFICALAVSASVAFWFAYDDFEAAWSGLFAALAITVAGFLAWRRKTQSWVVEYYADLWETERAERKLHPARARFKRRAKRILVWVPSLIAAVVLLDFPVATHVVCPALKHYRVPIPWNIAVVTPPWVPGGRDILGFATNARNGRFGMPRFWDIRENSSAMDFESRPDYAEASEYSGSAAGFLRKDFRSNGLTLTCWQSVNSYSRIYHWLIACQTSADAASVFPRLALPPGLRRPSLRASFYGREQDIPTFYKIIEGVTPID